MSAPTPSRYCAPYLTRKQAEELLALVRAQRQAKWAPHERNLLRALRENANGQTYPERALESAPRGEQ